MSRCEGEGGGEVEGQQGQQGEQVEQPHEPVKPSISYADPPPAGPAAAHSDSEGMEPVDEDVGDYDLDNTHPIRGDSPFMQRFDSRSFSLFDSLLRDLL